MTPQEKYALEKVVQKLLDAVKEQYEKTGYYFLKEPGSHTPNSLKPIVVWDEAIGDYKRYMKKKGL